MAPMARIHPARPRETVQVHFPNGRAFEGPVGAPLGEFIHAAYPDPTVPAVAAVMDGKLRELGAPVWLDVETRPVFLTDSEGIRIYTRSLSFLLAACVRELFPGTRLVIDHSVPFGGYYCRLVGRPPFIAEELSRIEARMRELVMADLPIAREEVPLAEAQEWFRRVGSHRKADLLAQNGERSVSLYRLLEFRDHFFGPMVPSTGYLRYFALTPYHDGFILRFPRRERPKELAPVEDYSALWQVFVEYGRWLELLGVYDAQTMNEAVRTGRIQEVILVSEALHEQRIVQIAEMIAKRPLGRRRLVLIAGPSASGKTTFGKRLAIQLLARGLRPYFVCLDDYFLPREEMAKLGLTDFDDLQAVDLPLLREQVEALFFGERVRLPRFDFPTGTRLWGSELQLDEDGILLLEGIHCLNPSLLPRELRENAFKIYVSALTQLNLDDHVRLSTTDTRLIRRVVRDAASRGYSAEDTLRMWSGVRRGEKRNIFPYQGQADVMFNSALAYEWSVLGPRAEALLLQVQEPRLSLEAERLLGILRWIAPYPGEEVPATSILREFMGGGILSAYFPSPLERAAQERT